MGLAGMTWGQRLNLYHRLVTPQTLVSNLQQTAIFVSLLMWSLLADSRYTRCSSVTSTQQQQQQESCWQTLTLLTVAESLTCNSSTIFADENVRRSPQQHCLS